MAENKNALDPLIQELLNPPVDVQSDIVPADSMETPGADNITEIGGDFLVGSGLLFGTENILPAPPKPRDPDMNYMSTTTITTTKTTTTPLTTTIPQQETSPPKPRPLGERIEATQKMADLDKEFERKYLGKRARENFGQRFEIVNEFSIDTLGFAGRYVGKAREGAKPDPLLETGFTNRFSFYRYMQQRGIIMVDDTGLSSHATTATVSPDTLKSRVLLPTSIDKEVFYALEDEIRSVYPFRESEVRLKQLVVERDENRRPGPEEFLGDDEKMRELVDYLATDERFMSLFAQSEGLQEARRANRRADPKF